MIPTKEQWNYELSLRHGEKLSKKLSKSKVAVCGLGGLGSNIALCLSRMGVGKLILIDFDKVDITNIHRQQYKVSQIGRYKTEALCENIREINPYIETEIQTVCINNENATDLLSDADIICEAFDNAEGKAMLTEIVLISMPGKYFIAASGMAGVESSNLIKTRKINKCFYLCGDEISDVNEGIGLTASRVMLCAAHQAHMVLRIIAGQYDT